MLYTFYFSIFLLNLVSIVLRTMIYVSLFYDIETGDICPSMPIAIWEANSAYGNLYSTICPRSIIHIEELNFLCLLYLFQFFLYFNHSTICSIKKFPNLEILIDLILTTIHFQHFICSQLPFFLEPFITISILFRLEPCCTISVVLRHPDGRIMSQQQYFLNQDY